MNTIVSYITHTESDNRIYEQASEILHDKGLVAFPTETVYGLGADALDADASAKIYAAKGRPSDNPLIVHIADIDDCYRLSTDVNEQALKLAKAFWPGPLTIILKKSQLVPPSITGGLDTVAIRMPSHPVARELIRRSGVYIAAPSANTSGKPSPTRAKHVIHDMDGRIDMIIADDTVDIGVESTIVDVSGGSAVILRPGFITQEQIRGVLGECTMDPAISESVPDGVVPKAPGMKYKHYAPDAKIMIVRGTPENMVNAIRREAAAAIGRGSHVAVMASSETAGRYAGIGCDVYDCGSRLDEAAEARNLFSVLREFDEKGIDTVYSESFPTENVGQAVMNRLVKAAGHTVIDV